MKNEFGEDLDRNGYAPSIVQWDGENYCYMCYANGSTDPLNRHEIFGGAYREKSKRLGLWVYLCHSKCHQYGNRSVHQNAGINLFLKRIGQTVAMREYGWSKEDFIREFGKNYL